MTTEIKSEDKPTYLVKTQDDIIDQAMNILYSRITVPNFYATDPHSVRKYLMLKLANLEHEVFGVIFLDNRHGMIAYEEMFRGTIDGASVYPREVIKRSLEVNAVALILVHNHPSGNPEPSGADKEITTRIKKCAELMSMRVLDHLIVGGDSIISMAERGEV